MKANVLIVYHTDEYPLRGTIRDHLLSFERHSGHRCHYVNVVRRPVPRYLLDTRWDLVVFHTSFLSPRWNRDSFRTLVARAWSLRDVDAVKIVLPQDEFISTDLVCDFVGAFGVTHVFSVAEATEWPTIYSTLDLEAVQLHTVLTGYLEDETVRTIERLAQRAPAPRPIDVGYRAWRPLPCLGRHGLLKSRIAESFVARARGLACDVSLRPEDTFLGDEWYRFLLRCRWTIGVEGGASVFDRDGALLARTLAFLREHPDAPFEVVERACFPGMDGTLRLFALSPRHLEACATRTGQALVRGRYNGLLRAGEHYLEIAQDLANLEEVAERMKDEALRRELAERAYEDIVASRRATYRSFVDFVLEKSLRSDRRGRASDWARHAATRLRDRLEWAELSARHLARRVRARLRR